MASNFSQSNKVDNPQRINGINFKTPLTVNDMAILLLVFADDDNGTRVDINKIDSKLDSLKNLMTHNLVKIDIFECDEGYCYGFSVTEAGKQMCDKMMEIAKQ